MNKPINPTHENANFIYLNDLSQRRMARDLITKMIKQTETFAKDKTNKRNKTELTDQISALKHRALSYWLKNPIFFPRMTLFTFTFFEFYKRQTSSVKGICQHYPIPRTWIGKSWKKFFLKSTIKKVILWAIDKIWAGSLYGRLKRRTVSKPF